MDERRRRFEAQVMPHLDAAYRYARWLSGSSDDAQDLVQEAMLRAFRGFDALRDAHAKAWLLTIVRNCHFTAQRQRPRGRMQSLSDEDEAVDQMALASTEPGPEDVTLRADERRSLERLLQRLPDDYREILILREVEDMDYRAIAQLTGIPIGTVMSRLARARAALKKQWLMQPGEGSHVAP
ncbi:MAG TPA: sigma-70 family RNA polymerase sigma factor [Steroidobacteraceae bacterium]|jgi:RNA polymerase sigma-70 factor (ECF subfamily)|nr:sigma-70 family RNA polymerase sigma factor [Steroidobacteraceae bacterium]